MSASGNNPLFTQLLALGSVFFKGRPGHWATHRTRSPKETTSARLVRHYQYPSYNFVGHSRCWSHPITSTVGGTKAWHSLCLEGHQL